MQQQNTAQTSIFHRFAAYVMSDRKAAIMTAIVCSIVPMLGWLGIVVLCLVTLRKGVREGAYVLLWLLLPTVVIAAIAKMPSVLLHNFVYATLFTWILALVLRATRSWGSVLEASAVIAVAGIVVVHFIIGDVQQYWLAYLTKTYTWANQYLQTQLTAADIKVVASKVALFITGFQAAMLIVGNIINLAIARWMQSLLYNPGGFRKEAYHVRLQYISVLVIAACMLLTLTGLPISYDIVPVILLPAFVAGLSLLHQVMATARYSWFGLFAYYGLLILFFPYLLVVTVLAAVADAFFDFRQWIAEKKTLMLDKRG